VRLKRERIVEERAAPAALDFLHLVYCEFRAAVKTTNLNRAATCGQAIFLTQIKSPALDDQENWGERGG
jgi:hypothetical protein